MGNLTSSTCKCLAEIADGVTVFDLQVKFLLEAGITEICITTGHFSKNLEKYTREHYPNIVFNFVYNPLYNETNYIYSIHLAKDFLQDDILLLHGDLVFERDVLHDILASQYSVMAVDTTRALPPKDFKAVVSEGKISKVGVNEFGEGSCYAQPLYKLKKADWLVWLNEINRFCEKGTTSVYAENAFNTISQKINLLPLELGGRLCFEIDNVADFEYGKEVYRQLERQQFFEGLGSFFEAESIIKATGAKKIFVVCDASFKNIAKNFAFYTVLFSEFTPNPVYEDILAGVSLFEAEGCDFIISVGGGSAIDVAKCINILKDFSEINLLEKPRCKHLAIPTTAGTGSESTRFAVIYQDGEKRSIEHEEVLPNYVILDPKFLETLPLYHKKSAMLDALCQAIESIWAKGATNESKFYAKKAIPLILNNVASYIYGNPKSAKQILTAANFSGKAINISKTTAAHAMSYRLSSMFSIAHGHAVGLCMLYVWQHLIDERENHMLVKNSLDEISVAMGCKSCEEALAVFKALFEELKMPSGFTANDFEIKELVASVNAQRLNNHPIIISVAKIACIYTKLLIN